MKEKNDSDISLETLSGTTEKLTENLNWYNYSSNNPDQNLSEEIDYSTNPDGSYEGVNQSVIYDDDISLKTVDQLALETIRGLYGVGQERKNKWGAE